MPSLLTSYAPTSHHPTNTNVSPSSSPPPTASGSDPDPPFIPVAPRRRGAQKGDQLTPSTSISSTGSVITASSSTALSSDIAEVDVRRLKYATPNPYSIPLPTDHIPSTPTSLSSSRPSGQADPPSTSAHVPTTDGKKSSPVTSWSSAHAGSNKPVSPSLSLPTPSLRSPPSTLTPSGDEMEEDERNEKEREEEEGEEQPDTAMRTTSASKRSQTSIRTSKQSSPLSHAQHSTPGAPAQVIEIGKGDDEEDEDNVGKRQRKTSPPSSKPSTSPCFHSQPSSYTMAIANSKLTEEVQQLRLDNHHQEQIIIQLRKQMATLTRSLQQQGIGTSPQQNAPSNAQPPAAAQPAAPSLSVLPQPSLVSAASTALVTSSALPAAVMPPAVPSAAAAPKHKTNHVARRHTVEPSEKMLHAASIPTHSETDFIVAVHYAPLSYGKMSRRVHFPDFQHRPVEHGIQVGNQLQRQDGLQVTVPRIPNILLDCLHMSSTALEQKMAALQSQESHEYIYLHNILQSRQNGDQYDLLQHTFSDAECVNSWAKILAPTTQAYKQNRNSDGTRVTIRLSFAHPMIMEAALSTIAAHADRIKETIQSNAGRSQSPTPSTTSTVSMAVSEDEEEKRSRPAHAASSPSSTTLSIGALHSSIVISPYHFHYICTSVSNWPRQHPYELCGGDEQLHAFFHLHAPDLHLITRKEYGTTSSTTMVIGQRHHLHQLLHLQGKVSEEHGISYPLSLQLEVKMMGAQTCTHCWKPGHGARQCPHLPNAPKPISPTSSVHACRECYAFGHHEAACRSTGLVTCHLCKVPGHATGNCQHFKPTTSSLKSFLALAPTPTTCQSAKSSSQQRPAAGEILSAAHHAASSPWTLPFAPPDPATAPQSSPSSVPPSSPPSPPSPSTTATYITQQQLDLALAAINASLQLIMARLPPLSSPQVTQ
jgi:hypothetical protein